jgi:transcription elongation factor GreA
MTQSAQPASVWLTKKTYDRLSAELEDLRGPRRQEVIERISSARDEGDLKENGGYHAAKDEQGKIEASIRQLEEMLETAITDAPDDDGVVRPGKLVTYRYAGDDEAEKFLLGAREIEDDYEGSDFEVFSPQSPLGHALNGARKGETVEFEAPNGRTQRIEILDAVPFTD